MDENLIKRNPPHNPDAEKLLIGSMLLNDDALAYAAENLTKEDFYSAVYGWLFDAMKAICDAGRELDFLALKEKLKEQGAPDTLQDASVIRDITDSVTTSSNYKYNVKVVQDYSKVRRLIAEGERIANSGYQGKRSVEEQVEDAEKAIFALRQGNLDDEMVSTADVYYKAMEEIHKAMKNKGAVTGIPTGFPDLDRYFAGLQPSTLVLIAARPAMGKTAFALNIADYAALKHDYKVAIFSLEMSRQDLMRRFLAIEALVDSSKFKTGELDYEDMDKLVEVGSVFDTPNLMLFDKADITPTELRSKCRKIKLERGLDLIIIDYLQLMESGRGGQENRQQEISTISRSLKLLAKELDIPVIALSQLSRSVEQRSGDHKPMLSDLRESGAIEQDADVVMFIYREEVYKPDTEKKNLAEILISKNRSGSTGSVDLVWQPQYTRFASAERIEKPR
ncbi:MAG: replicative DNA helicase [Lachnospiraceae bacterium]|nr:replicative DNA helicase [Lachnospiraceae bacterium]